MFVLQVCACTKSAHTGKPTAARTQKQYEIPHPEKRVCFASLCMYEKCSHWKTYCRENSKTVRNQPVFDISTAFSPRFRLKKPKKSMKLGNAENHLPGDFQTHLILGYAENQLPGDFQTHLILG